MFKDMIPTWWYLVAGFGAGVVLMLVLMSVLGFWANWPRTRERQLEKRIDELEKQLGETDVQEDYEKEAQAAD